MYIYFFPVDFSERDSFIKSECGYQKNKGKDYLVINRWDCQTLSFCQSSDRLYIIAHGNTSVIGDGIRRTEKLTPEDLAKVLYGLGLPKYFEDGGRRLLRIFLMIRITIIYFTANYLVRKLALHLQFSILLFRDLTHLFSYRSERRRSQDV